MEQQGGAGQSGGVNIDAKDSTLNVQGPIVGGNLTIHEAAQAWKAPRQIPAPPADFTGRAAEAALSLSYDLLDEAQQQRWRALATFPGGFARAAAAALWGEAEGSAVPALSALVAQSLVQWAPPAQGEEAGRYRLHDLAAEGTRLGSLGNAYAALGEVQKAIDFYQQHLAIAREIGDRRGESIALWNLALALDSLGERAEAIRHAQASLVIHEQIEDPWAGKVRAALASWEAKGEEGRGGDDPEEGNV